MRGFAWVSFNDEREAPLVAKDRELFFSQAVSMLLLLKMVVWNGNDSLIVDEWGGQTGCWLLFLCFVLWPWSGRFCETLTKQERLRGLPNCRGAGSWDCGGWYLECMLRRTCSARELVDRQTLSEREGWGFGLAWGV